MLENKWHESTEMWMEQVRSLWEGAIWAAAWKCCGSSYIIICRTSFQVKGRTEQRSMTGVCLLHLQESKEACMAWAQEEKGGMVRVEVQGREQGNKTDFHSEWNGESLQALSRTLTWSEWWLKHSLAARSRINSREAWLKEGDQLCGDGD